MTLFGNVIFTDFSHLANKGNSRYAIFSARESGFTPIGESGCADDALAAAPLVIQPRSDRDKAVRKQREKAMKIAVTTPTGHVESAVTEFLLDFGGDITVKLLGSGPTSSRDTSIAGRKWPSAPRTTSIISSMPPAA